MTLYKTKEKNKKTYKLDKFQAVINSILALVLILLSIASVFFFIIPNINQAFKLKHKIETQAQEVKALERKKNDLNSYSMQQLNDIYNKTLYFIPENINLGTMGTHLNQMAKNYNLSIQKLVLTEEPETRAINVPGFNKNSGFTLPIKTVTAPFIMIGEKQNLLSFMNTLTTSLEAQEFNTVQLSKSESTVWTIRLQLTHLYMEYIKDIPLSSTLPVINKTLLQKLDNEIKKQGGANLTNPSVTPSITPSITPR